MEKQDEIKQSIEKLRNMAKTAVNDYVVRQRFLKEFGLKVFSAVRITSENEVMVVTRNTYRIH